MTRKKGNAARLTDLLRELTLLALLVGVGHAAASLAGAGKGVGRVGRDAGRGRVSAVRADVDRGLAVLGSAVLGGGDHYGEGENVSVTDPIGLLVESQLTFCFRCGWWVRLLLGASEVRVVRRRTS